MGPATATGATNQTATAVDVLALVFGARGTDRLSRRVSAAMHSRCAIGHWALHCSFVNCHSHSFEIRARAACQYQWPNLVVLAVACDGAGCGIWTDINIVRPERPKIAS